MQRWREARHYGFWSELNRALKDRAQDNKEIKEALEQLKEDETIAKTKDTLNKLSEKSKDGVEMVKKAVGSQTTVGGELLKGGVAKVSETVEETWEKVKEKTHIDETIISTAERTVETLDKASKLIDKTGDALIATAEKSALYKHTQRLAQKVSAPFRTAETERPLLGEGSRPTTQSTDDTGEPVAAPPPGGALATTRATDAVQQR